MIQVVCIGAHQESKVALERMLHAGIRPEALVTLTPRVAKDWGVSDYCDLRPLCAQNGIHVINTDDINSSLTVEKLQRLRPDYLYTLGWNQIFRDALLSVPRRFSVGSHPTMLPDGRGRAPIPWTLLRGLERTAITLFAMDAGADTGDIVLQEEFEVPRDRYSDSLYHATAAALGHAFVRFHRLAMDRRVVRTPQDHSIGSIYARRSPADGHIDWSLPADLVLAHIRAVSHPYPGAYSYFKDSRLRFFRADPVPQSQGLQFYARPGQVVGKTDAGWQVMCGDGPLIVSAIRAEPGHARKPRVGESLGYRVEDEIHALRMQLGLRDA